VTFSTATPVIDNYEDQLMSNPLTGNMVRMTAKEQLANAVQQLRAWAEANVSSHRGGEWETEYPDWDSLHMAANAVLRADCDDWDEETKRMLLYAIARDNEVLNP